MQQTGVTETDYDSLAHAYPLLNIRASFKNQAQDFVVEEQLPFTLTGAGEHVWLYVEKTNTNTDWLAQQLARYAGVKSNAVGYAGLKDRHAVTRQWFSVQLPGIEGPDWQQLDIPGVTVLEVMRHQRKLHRGAARANRFSIVLCDIDTGMDALMKRCAMIQQQGVPNYFGRQRFGHGFANLREAEVLFSGRRKKLTRHKRSLLLSAARSWLFNQMLSARVQAHNWNTRLGGDVFMLDGRRACFSDDASAELDARLRNGDIHPTAGLWGDGDSGAEGDCRRLEQQIVDAWPVFKTGLVNARVEPQRRACRVLPRDMRWQAETDGFRLEFSLPAGSYATAVLRELVLLNEPRRANITTETEQKAVLV